MSNFEILGLPIDELGVFLAGAHPGPVPHSRSPPGGREPRRFASFVPTRRKSASSSETVSEPDVAGGSSARRRFLPGCPAGTDARSVYRLRIVRWDGSEQIMHDPYRYGADHGRGGSASLRRRAIICELYEKFGAHLRDDRRRDGRLLRGLGAERAARQRGRRFQWLGWPRPIRCADCSAAAFGKFSPRRAAKARITNSRSGRRPARSC